MSEFQELFYQSHNSDGLETIVFLHGLFSSSTEYTPAIPYISTQYHLLIPDLPRHSNSSGVPIASLRSVVDHVSRLISTHAHHGKAHIVGLSFGGYIALALAADHPELVLTCFATGISTTFEGLLGTLAPYLSYGFMKPMLAIPGVFPWLASRSGFVLPPTLAAQMTSNLSWRTSKDGYGALTGFRLRPIHAKTLLCAGAKGDRIGSLGGYLEVIRRDGGNTSSQAVVADEMEHAWDLQAPELFANLVQAWIEGGDFPAGIIKLSEWDLGKGS